VNASIDIEISNTPEKWKFTRCSRVARDLFLVVLGLALSRLTVETLPYSGFALLRIQPPLCPSLPLPFLSSDCIYSHDVCSGRLPFHSAAWLCRCEGLLPGRQPFCHLSFCLAASFHFTLQPPVAVVAIWTYALSFPIGWQIRYPYPLSHRRLRS
jgi:hypothetical protein